MNESDQYLEALKKRALGYDYEETQTLIEETPTGKKKKILKYKRHMPADVATAKWLLRKTEQAPAEFATEFEELNEKLKEVINNGD